MGFNLNIAIATASPEPPEALDLPEKSGRRGQLVVRIRMCQGDC